MKPILNLSVDTEKGFIRADWLEKGQYNIVSDLARSEQERMEAVAKVAKMATWIEKAIELMSRDDRISFVFQQHIDEAPI